MDLRSWACAPSATVDLGVITGIEGQASYYHVDFSNRLLNIAPYNFINPAPAILVNVGGVTTNGVDMAGTLNFGAALPALRRGLLQQVDLQLELPAAPGGAPTRGADRRQVGAADARTG